MCDPVTALVVGGMLASGTGTFMSAQEENANMRRAQNAKNNAFAAGMTRQHQYADEASSGFNKNLETQGSQAFNDQAGTEQQRMKDAFARVETAEPDYNSIPASTPKNVIIASQEANAKADEKTNRDLTGLSNLAGYGRAMDAQSLDRNAFARLFGNIQDKAQAQKNLIPLEMNSAAINSQKPGSFLAPLLKYGGMAASMAGTMGVDPTTWFSSTSSGTPFVSGGQTGNVGFGPFTIRPGGI